MLTRKEPFTSAIVGALVALSIIALVLSLVRVEDVTLPPTVKVSPEQVPEPLVSPVPLGRCSEPAAGPWGWEGQWGQDLPGSSRVGVLCPLRGAGRRKSEGKAPLELIPTVLCQVWRLPWVRCSLCSARCAPWSCQLPPVRPYPHTMAQTSCLPLSGPGHGIPPCREGWQGFGWGGESFWGRGGG